MEGGRIVLFDGVCNVCSAWTQFLIRRDPQRQFRYASLQGRTGQEILRQAGVPGTDDLVETMVYVRDGKTLVRSSAFLAVMADLGYPWKVLSWFAIVPRFLRDAVYALIARNRYALFGRKDACMIPPPDVKELFLE